MNRILYNVDTINGSQGKGNVFAYEYGTSGQLGLCFIMDGADNAPGTGTDTFQFVHLRRSAMQSVLNSEGRSFATPYHDLSEFSDELTPSYTVATAFSADYRALDSSFNNMTDLASKRLYVAGVTSFGGIYGTGVDVPTNVKLGKPKGWTADGGLTTTSTGQLTAAQQLAQEAKLAAIAAELKRKDGILSFLNSFKSSTYLADNTKPNTLDGWLNKAQDNPIIFIGVVLLAWNYIIQPNFFPKVKFLTWGKKKGK